ncbi:MAG: AGE family epimerase/isomerase [Sphaerochaetaceae bacterium]|nr:AGE family epimerase/isomerase [Sphaerochaetaceae bacterium]
MDAEKTREWVKAELDRCIAFWLDHGMDKVNGGIYTCLDRQGRIYSTDKSVWMQSRCAWIFAYLCNVYGKRQAWLEASRSCLDFMEAHCLNHDKGGRMYFTVTAEGEPLRQRRYCFSEGFYAIANAEYYAATKQEAYLQRALWAYDLIWKLNRGLMEDPVGMGPKSSREGRSLANPMIYLNICSVLRRCDPEHKDLYDQRSEICVHDILAYHLKEDLGCTLESVGMNGEVWDAVTEGRVVNPGHDIECSWFLAEYALYRKDDRLLEKAQLIFSNAINAGWDKEYGGLLYFIDAKGLPPESYEHDMKLWWPHDEILIASLLFYKSTGNIAYLDWFEKTLDYCQKHFSDPQYGEWYGYLRRDGKPTQPPAKGSTFKGPFHLPRMLIMVFQMLESLK